MLSTAEDTSDDFLLTAEQVDMIEPGQVFIPDTVINGLISRLKPGSRRFQIIINAVNLEILRPGHLRRIFGIHKQIRNTYDYNDNNLFWDLVLVLMQDFYYHSSSVVKLGEVIDAYVYVVKALGIDRLNTLLGHLDGTENISLLDLLELTDYPQIHLFQQEN